MGDVSETHEQRRARFRELFAHTLPKWVADGKVPPELGDPRAWVHGDFGRELRRMVGLADARAVVCSALCYVIEDWYIDEYNDGYFHVLCFRQPLLRGELLKHSNPDAAQRARLFDHAALLGLLEHKALRRDDGDHAVVHRVALYLFSAVYWCVRREEQVPV
jgi:hypothetical protein